MAGVLSEMMRKINVNEAEEEIVVFDGDNGNNDSQSCLKRTVLGREHTDLPYNFQRMKKALVLEDGPWSFERNEIMLKPIENDKQPTETEMTKVPFWIRLINPPLSNRNESSVRRIAANIGDVLEVDNTYFTNGSKHIRVKEMIIHNGHMERKNSEGKSGNSHDHFILPITGSCSPERNPITHNTDEGKSTDGNNIELSQINESSKKKLNEEEGVSGVATNSNLTSTLNIMGQKDLKTSNWVGLELDIGRNLECSLNKSIKAQADVENTILSKSWKRRTREETHTKSTSGTRSISIVGKRSLEELDNGDQMDVDIVKKPKEVGEHNLTTTSVAAQHRRGQ
ncbi:reverse transcriptase [Tanacetum coccineum]